MPHFILKAPGQGEGVRYEIPQTLTIGEQKAILREFGQDAAGLGVIWIAVRREYPNTAPEDIDECTVEYEEDEAEKLPPTFAVAKPSSAENGKSTEPADTGSHGSESTMASSRGRSTT